MTVKELRKKLKEYPDDATVVTSTDTGYNDVTKVEGAKLVHCPENDDEWYYGSYHLPIASSREKPPIVDCVILDDLNDNE